MNGQSLGAGLLDGRRRALGHGDAPHEMSPSLRRTAAPAWTGRGKGRKIRVFGVGA
jgi:hypothetical protein